MSSGDQFQRPISVRGAWAACQVVRTLVGFPGTQAAPRAGGRQVERRVVRSTTGCPCGRSPARRRLRSRRGYRPVGFGPGGASGLFGRGCGLRGLGSRGGRTARLPWHGGHGRRTARRGAARGRPGRAARPVTPNVGACPPGRGGRTFGAGGGGCGAAGRARRRRGRGVAAEGLGRTARLPRRPASRRGSRARRHRRSRRCAGRRVGGHGPLLRGAVRESTIPTRSRLWGVQGERGSSARRGRCASVASSPASAPSNFTVKPEQPEQPAEQKSAMTRPSRICPRQ